MKQLGQLLTLLWLMLSALTPAEGGEQGRVYTPEAIPNVQLRDSTRLLSDPEAYLSWGEREIVNDALRDLRSRYGVEFAVVLIPSLGERDIEGFATELLRLWGLGSKGQNDGLLLLVAIEQSRMRWEVGYGLEGVMTDAVSGDIWRNAMRPYFQRGDYGGGLRVGISAVAERLERSELRADGSRVLPEEGGGYGAILLFVLGLGFLLSLFFVQELHTRLSLVRTPEQARSALPQLTERYRSTLGLLALLCLPVAGVMWLLRSRYLGRISRLSMHCRSCGHSTMRPAPERAVESRLTPYQRTELSLGTKTFALYACSNCGTEEVAPSRVEPTPYTACPSCGSVAMQALQPKLIGRDSMGRPIVRVGKRCLACSHEEHHDEHGGGGLGGEISPATVGTILVLSRFLGGGGGGWGSGGGHSGGSFGGGSSGGGGYSGRW